MSSNMLYSCVVWVARCRDWQRLHRRLVKIDWVLNGRCHRPIDVHSHWEKGSVLWARMISTRGGMRYHHGGGIVTHWVAYDWCGVRWTANCLIIWRSPHCGICLILTIRCIRGCWWALWDVFLWRWRLLFWFYFSIRALLLLTTFSSAIFEPHLLDNQNQFSERYCKMIKAWKYSVMSCRVC